MTSLPATAMMMTLCGLPALRSPSAKAFKNRVVMTCNESSLEQDMLLAGFLIDATVLIIVLTPIVLPLVRAQGGDPVHFGIVFIVAATLGNFTPPVGAAMYAVCTILKVPVGAYARASIPLPVAVTLALILMIFVPSLILLLPNLMF